MAVFLPVCLLAGCATSPTSQSRAQAPASQEVVLGEARTRAKAHTDLGFEYYAQNQFGVALQEAKTALNHDSSYTPAYNLLALVYMSLGDNKSAEEAFLRARQLSPGDPEIANNYGLFLCRTKREQQSFHILQRSLAEHAVSDAMGGVNQFRGMFTCKFRITKRQRLICNEHWLWFRTAHARYS